MDTKDDFDIKDAMSAIKLWDDTIKEQEQQKVYAESKRSNIVKIILENLNGDNSFNFEENWYGIRVYEKSGRHVLINYGKKQPGSWKKKAQENE
jgi:hypothetical protein